MLVTKEILSFYSGGELAIELLLKILLSNNSYTERLQRIAKDVARQTGVIFDE